MMNKIVSGRVAINIDEHLTRASTRTRSANSIKFRTLSAKTVLYQNSFFPRTVVEWNNTSDIVVGEIGNYLSADCLD